MPLAGWWAEVNQLEPYEEPTSAVEHLQDVLSTLLLIGFGSGLLFVPFLFLAASDFTFRTVKLPAMLVIALLASFCTFWSISQANFAQYLQSKGVLWVCLGLLFSAGTVLFRYYRFRKRIETPGGP